MTIKRGFGVGVTYGKHSTKLNVPSDKIDRRKNPAFRAGSVRKGKLVDGKIVWEDGDVERLDV